MKPAVTTAELVMKACVMFSVVVGTLGILPAFLGNKTFFEVADSVLPTVGLQWFFYLLVRARKRSDQEAELKSKRLIEE